MNKFGTASRRGFLKKSMYSAPVVLALGHLAPSMVYGADSVVLPAQQPAVTVTGKTSNPVPGAGSGSGSGNTGSGVIGTTTDGGGGNGTGGENNTPTANTDSNATN